MKTTVAQAGAITVRLQNNEVQFLLVRSKKNPSVWIFPKGHIEAGESDLIASGRELTEEAGVEGKAIANAGTLAFSVGDKNYIVNYYVHEYQKTVSYGEPGRDPQWRSYEETLKLLSFSNSRDLLISANSLIKKYLQRWSD